MKKYWLLFYKLGVGVIVIALIFCFSLFIAKKDEMVTENITLNYFVDSMNNFNKDNLKEFVANSENDVLYKNAIQTYELYHYEGVRNYHFQIDSYELFGNGKYQCYIGLRNIPACDLEHEGQYVNYLIDTTTSFTTPIGENRVIKEKGLVVFVKDATNGNIFEWKLVRYNSYVVE